ncbi:MAG: radical SAM protein [Candidatus Woesearchaeota archaeon]
MKKIHESYTIAENENIPSMRIAITGACNLKCQYCPIDGDNYKLHGKRFLTTDEFSHISRISNNIGIRHFNITGGEPLAVPDSTFKLAETIKEFPNLGYLRLNTNGISLKKHASTIKRLGFDKVKVSIDSLKTGKHQLNSSKRYSQNYVSEVMQGIYALKEIDIPIRVNMVVGKYNIKEVLDMIDFCEKNELELKLFDITFYRDALSKNKNFWLENYVSLFPIAKELELQFGSPRIVYAVGGFGNPMPVFKPDSQSPIRLRISENSAMYSEGCYECQDYICQDGFCNITLTTDGDIKPCRPEGLDFGLKLVDQDGNLLPDEEIEEKLMNTIKLFQDVKEKKRSLDDMVSSWCENHKL